MTKDRCLYLIPFVVASVVCLLDAGPAEAACYKCSWQTCNVCYDYGPYQSCEACEPPHPNGCNCFQAGLICASGGTCLECQYPSCQCVSNDEAKSTQLAGVFATPAEQRLSALDWDWTRQQSARCLGSS